MRRIPKGFRLKAQGWREELAPTLGNFKRAPTLKELHPLCMTRSEAVHEFEKLEQPRLRSWSAVPLHRFRNVCVE